ncbi:MAG TPA: glycosyltransferase, partial [Polyangiaceae bacterium]
MHFVLCTAYFAVLLVLAMYGLHRSHLVLTVLRNRRKLQALKEGIPALPTEGLAGRDELPHVTIQLPLYNEATVAARLLDHVAAIEWPRSRLEIQVLDDSTDETRALVRAKVESLREGGLDVVYIHRVDRTGYKAGA